MVSTERCSIAWSAALELGRELVLQPLGRELDRRQRVLDLVGQAPRHLAPGLDALRRDQLGDVVEDHQPRALRHRRAAHQQRDRRPLAPRQAAGLQLERVLPVVALAGLGAGGVHLEALPDRLAERADARHLVEPAAAVGRERQPQDPGRAGIDGVDRAARGRTRSRRRSGCRGWSAGWRARPRPGPRSAAPARAPRRAASSSSANERVRPPSSSREANTAFELKSPCATWSTPSASSSSGWASWLLRAIASSSAPNTASTSASVRVPMYILRRPLRASARCWYSR